MCSECARHSGFVARECPKCTPQLVTQDKYDAAINLLIELALGHLNDPVAAAQRHLKHIQEVDEARFS